MTHKTTKLTYMISVLHTHMIIFDWDIYNHVYCKCYKHAHLCFLHEWQYINLWHHKDLYEGLGILVTNQHLEGTVSVQRGPGMLVASQQLTAKAMPVLSMSRGLCISCEAALCTGWICTTATQNSWCGSHCLSRKSDMPDHLFKNWSLLTKHFPKCTFLVVFAYFKHSKLIQSSFNTDCYHHAHYEIMF